MSKDISADCPYEPKFVDVLDSSMAYLDSGRGDPIVLIHGNPARAYMWRNISPYLETKGRCLAPDLMGMGDSGAMPTGGYRYVQHAAYLDAWFDAVVPDGKITFVVQDWGGALGFDWANRHRDRVKGIAYMEVMVQPSQWVDLADGYRQTFQNFRTKEGFNKSLESNFFVEKVMPNGTARMLSKREMDVYRKPFVDRDARLPTVVWPTEIPFDGEPADTHERVQAYADWLSTSAELPKLFINTTDGHSLAGRNREFCRTWPNQKEIIVKGKHFIQEDDPHGIGQGIADWMDHSLS